MGSVRSTMAGMLAAALVAGCGGGGGGSGSTNAGTGAGAPGSAGTAPASNGAPAATPGGSWLTLTPGTMSLNAFPGEAVPFQVNARSSRVFDKPFNVAVVDSKGIISTDMSLTKITDLEYTVNLRTAALKAGVNTTYLQVRLCEDDPLVCNTPLPGSPWYLPVSVNVASDAEAKERLKLAPAAFDLAAYEGESLSFTLDATAPAVFGRPVWVGVFDSAGMLANKGAVMPLNQIGKTSIPLSTSPTLAVGEHAGTLQVRLCYDIPVDCRSPVGGSPWSVPLKVGVKSNTNLTQLSAIPSLSPWSTYRANATQNAYVPASFPPAAFSGRWIKQNRTGVTTSAPVVDNGRVFALYSGTGMGKLQLVAISEATGEELWNHDISVLTDPNSLATGNGRVFVRSSGPEGVFLWTLDQATGQLISKTALNTPGQNQQLAPVVVGDMVYLGHNAGMEKFNAAVGVFEWSNLSMPVMATLWTPTVSAGRAYALLGDTILVLDTADGSIVSRLQEPALNDNTYAIKPLVVAGNLGIAASGLHLAAYDLQSLTRKWTTGSGSIDAPVVANDTVYTLGDNILQARAATTGLLQWQSGPIFEYANEMGNGRLVVTSNLAFVSGGRSTKAIDLATHQVVWSYPLGGQLAISDRGVLYILAQNGKMAAINLR